MHPMANPPAHRLVLEPPGRFSVSGLAEIWDYRELLYFLAWRDVKVRYKQAFLGLAWALLQPLLFMALFSLVFGRLAGVPSQGVPYPVFAFAGLIPWTYFVNAAGDAANSLVGNSNLVSKVYFPRLVMPLATLLVWLPDLLVGSVATLVVMALFGMTPSWPILVFPLAVGLAMATAFSIGVWFSALNVAYRDVRYALPFILQLWLFATPVAYPATSIPDSYQWIIALNPVSGVVSVFRWCLTGQTPLDLSSLAVSISVTLALALGGMLYFRRVEQFFADVI